MCKRFVCFGKLLDNTQILNCEFWQTFLIICNFVWALESKMKRTEVYKLAELSTFVGLSHIRPLRQKFSFELAYNELFENFSIDMRSWRALFAGFHYDLQLDFVWRQMSKNILNMRPIDFRVWEYAQFAITWYDHSLESNFHRTPQYCIDYAAYWANKCLVEYQSK